MQTDSPLILKSQSICYLTYHRHIQITTDPIHINNTPLTRVVGSTFEEKTIQFLALNVETSLHGKNIFRKFVPKLLYQCSFFNEVKYTLPAHVLKSLYYSLHVVHGHMIYGLLT